MIIGFLPKEIITPGVVRKDELHSKSSTVTFSEFIMEYQWYDFVGNIGVFLILLAYLFLQLGKINSQSIRFGLLNAFGALSILISLYFKFNLSAFIIELFWLLISLVGIIGFWVSKKSAENTANS